MPCTAKFSSDLARATKMRCSTELQPVQFTASFSASHLTDAANTHIKISASQQTTQGGFQAHQGASTRCLRSSAPMKSSHVVAFSTPASLSAKALSYMLCCTHQGVVGPRLRSPDGIVCWPRCSDRRGAEHPHWWCTVKAQMQTINIMAQHVMHSPGACSWSHGQSPPSFSHAS